MAVLYIALAAVLVVTTFSKLTLDVRLRRVGRITKPRLVLDVAIGMAVIFTVAYLTTTVITNGVPS